MIDTDKKKIEALLTRGVEEIFVRKHLIEQLESGKQLRIKMGIDPTGPKIHLGRASALRKLKAFQDLGHQLVLIIGDFTARTGDASDKDSKRPMLTKEQVEENLKEYKIQIGKILDLEKVEWRYNSEWLGELDFNDVAELAEHFSAQQMLRRRNFAERYEAGNEISIREFMYPLMQGYDSVAVKADVEIGGFDQLFNLQAGRVLQKAYQMSEQDIMTCTMLEGTDGRKMSTSWDNMVTIVDEPQDMFGKIMAVRDELMVKYFTLCTDVSMEEIQKIETQLQDADINPRDIKMRLAKEIVALYHGEQVAQKAEQNFKDTFSGGGIPENIKEVHVASGALLGDVLLGEGLVTSKAGFRRLIEGKGIHNLADDSVISDPYFKIEQDITLRIGKKEFIKIIL